MIINGTVIISEYAPSTVKEGVIWVDVSTSTPKIKLFTKGVWSILNDAQEIESTSWQDITNKPSVIAAGETQQAARTAIGAGTSNLTIGTTASTAKAGNYQPTWAEVTGKPSTFTPTIGTTATTAKAGNYSPTSDDISDATAVGKSVLVATDAAAARTAIGAGTSNLVIGTTSSTAKAGDYQPTWAQVTGKPAVIAAGADQAAARTAIGAGTSNLALGITSSTAYAGDQGKANSDSIIDLEDRVLSLEGLSESFSTKDHNHSVAAHAESGLAAASTIQAFAQAISARIKALEDAATE